jgi:hypothetical protein
MVEVLRNEVARVGVGHTQTSWVSRLRVPHHILVVGIDLVSFDGDYDWNVCAV